MKSSSQVRVAIELAGENPQTLPGKCPGCGQRIDSSTRLCPRCLLWLLPLPARSKHSGGTARAAGIVLLGFASAIVALVLYVLLSNEPPDIVLPDVRVTVVDE